MRGYRITVLVVLAAVFFSGGAAALPGAGDVSSSPSQPSTAGEPSCIVASMDGPGAGVTPFVDLAAVGARVGTGVGSVTAAVYTYSCTTVILQIADPNRPLPRDPLPEDTPYKKEIMAVVGMVLP